MQGVTVPARRNPLTVRIGRNIVRARGLAGLSQGALLRAQDTVVERDETGEPVERLFVDRELSAWENGRHRPSDRYLSRIAAITGQTLGFFFESHDDPEV